MTVRKASKFSIDTHSRSDTINLINILTAWFTPYRDKRMITLLALGFSSGLPAPLVFSNLSIWLRDEGVSRSDIGLFALAATPYAINFLWAPLLDRLRIPYLTARFGRRRSWALVSQVGLMLAILYLSLFNPADGLFMMAVAVLGVTFMSATQDIVIDAYRIEILDTHQYGSGSAAGIWGWHLGGTLIGGAGGLYLAHSLGWNIAYLLLGCMVLVGIMAVLLSPEPKIYVTDETRAEEARALAHLERWSALPRLPRRVIGWLYVTLLAPLMEFTKREGWVLILVFIFIFKLGDALLGRMSGVFYRELGFTLPEIAEVAKVYGLTANLIGIVIGGILVARIGILRALFLAGFSTAATNLTYSWLAASGQSMGVFIFAVASDNFTTGLVTVALVAYLSSLCNSAYTATQYALLASLANLARIWFSASSGIMVDALDGDWTVFFTLCAVIALLGLPLLWVIMRRYPNVS
ncbi:AmpG family muropeptide MFS transporter [Nitrincola nitratireducens]|uniref:AmpG family muropeptide MFS transporter n=1 Tax=Nitrincola nitratireducens TaxID=1229521 RepID=UPI001ED99BA2|nr:MFS transporter [Nitrincola nitratireducens]